MTFLLTPSGVVLKTVVSTACLLLVGTSVEFNVVGTVVTTCLLLFEASGDFNGGKTAATTCLLLEFESALELDDGLLPCIKHGKIQLI